MNALTRRMSHLHEMGLSNRIKLYRNIIIAPFVPKYIAWRWEKKGKNSIGITANKRDVPLIISLTTYPKRINTIHLVIQSLLCQSLKPDMIVLWLAIEQFPNKENDLPDELIQLKKNGLTIEWCNDIKSYKKLIPTIIKWPNSYIITVDDDLYYLPSVVKRLYLNAKEKPTEIHCHRGTKFIIKDGVFETIPGGYITYNKSTYLHKLTGCCGVCYPPNVLYKDLTNEKLFMKLAPTNDDIWFWLMGVLKGTKCNIIKNNLPGLFEVPNSQVESLSSINDKGDCLFWNDFNAVLDYYPIIKDILKKEYDEVQNKNEKNK